MTTDDERIRELEMIVDEMDRVMVCGRVAMDQLWADLKVLLLTVFTAGLVVGVYIARLVQG